MILNPPGGSNDLLSGYGDGEYGNFQGACIELEEGTLSDSQAISLSYDLINALSFHTDIPNRHYNIIANNLVNLLIKNDKIEIDNDDGSFEFKNVKAVDTLKSQLENKEKYDEVTFKVKTKHLF